MRKLTAKDILKPGVTLDDIRKSWPTKEEMKPFIEETIKQQAAILKLKEVSPGALELRITI